MLLVIAGHVIDSTTTDAKGRYTFSYTPQPPASIQTRFGGSRTGQHPHKHICQASASRVVTTGAVAGAGGAAGGTGGTEQVAATAASTGADLRVPIALMIIALLLGASSLLLARRRSG